MRVREAKDFLVEQTVKQAEMEGIPLSELEKRMMYFTEGKSAVEDPVSLNEEFEAQYDNAKYERKISRLMGGAYKRLRHENSVDRKSWDSAVRCLKKGDHYILVLCGETSRFSALWGIGAIAVLLLIAASIKWFTSTIQPPNPHVLLAVFVGVIATWFFFPRHVGRAFSWVMSVTVYRFFGDEKDEG